jgi:hypothetical protein
MKTRIRQRIQEYRIKDNLAYFRKVKVTYLLLVQLLVLAVSIKLNQAFLVLEDQLQADLEVLPIKLAWLSAEFSKVATMEKCVTMMMMILMI